MIELIRNSQVPANIVRSASKGALALPAPEMIEILVFLTNSPIFGEQARMTLAGWDAAASLAVCSDPASPPEVLDYFLRNRRPKLMPALLENPSVPEKFLLDMAQEQSAESIALLLASPRAAKSANILQALHTNPALTSPQHEKVNQALLDLGEIVVVTDLDEADAILAQYQKDHADEIAAEHGKAFELVGATTDETAHADSVCPTSGAPATDVGKKKEPEERERLSTVQKVSRLTVGERVQLAMKGTKDERFVLIRDGSKVVSSAVLESPKVSDQEIETFASMKNVQESVLRGIAGKRKYMKMYSVVRNLVNNPRCPLDVQLNLVKQLLTQDLRALSMNKNVSETVRKLALKSFKERTEKKGGGGE